MSHLKNEDGVQSIRRLSRADSIGEASNFGGMSEVDINKYLIEQPPPVSSRAFAPAARQTDNDYKKVPSNASGKESQNAFLQ